MPRWCYEFVDSRLRRSPPDRASAVPYGQAGENAMRFPHLAHRSAAAHKLHSTPQQDRMNLISGKGETSSRLPAFSLFLPRTCPNDRHRRRSHRSDKSLRDASALNPSLERCSVGERRRGLSSALASVIRQARSWTVTASYRDEASDFSWRWPHRTRRHRLHKTMAHLEAAVDLIQADWTGTTQLKNPGLLRRFFEGLPPGGNARHKGIAPLALQNRFAGGILPIDGDKGLRDLFDQRRVLSLCAVKQQWL